MKCLVPTKYEYTRNMVYVSADDPCLNEIPCSVHDAIDLTPFMAIGGIPFDFSPKCKKCGKRTDVITYGFCLACASGGGLVKCPVDHSWRDPKNGSTYTEQHKCHLCKGSGYVEELE